MTKNYQAEVDLLAQEWPLWQRFQLDHDPLIVIVGAYKGKLMQLMLQKFPEAEVVGFEPQMWACKEILDRLQGFEDRYFLHSYGLGVEDALNQVMGEFGTDACSFVNTGKGAREHGLGDLVEADSVLKLLSFPIDLMIMNIEGYEYLLLPHLIAKGSLNVVERLAVQFHLDLVEGLDKDKMNLTINNVSECGFHIVEDQRPTWVYWER